MSRIVTFVLAEGPAARQGLPQASRHGRGTALASSQKASEAKPLHSAPQYYGEASPKQFLVEQDGDVTIKSYQPDVLLAEASRDVKDAFSTEAFAELQHLEAILLRVLPTGRVVHAAGAGVVSDFPVRRPSTLR